MDGVELVALTEAIDTHRFRAARAPAEVVGRPLPASGRNIVCNFVSDEQNLECVVSSESSPTKAEALWHMRATGSAAFRWLLANVGTEVGSLPYGQAWNEHGFVRP